MARLSVIDYKHRAVMLRWQRYSGRGSGDAAERSLSGVMCFARNAGGAYRLGLRRWSNMLVGVYSSAVAAYFAFAAGIVPFGVFGAALVALLTFLGSAFVGFPLVYHIVKFIANPLLAFCGYHRWPRSLEKAPGFGKLCPWFGFSF